MKFPKIVKNTFFEKHLRTAASLSRLLGWVKVKKITIIISQGSGKGQKQAAAVFYEKNFS